MRLPIAVGISFVLGAVMPAQALETQDVVCLARVAYGEARGEPLKVKFLTTWSILLRAAANLKAFGGSTICGVVYHTTTDPLTGKVTRQYDGAWIPVTDRAAWADALVVARRTLKGDGQPNMPVMFFCNPDVQAGCGWHDKSPTTRYVGTMGHHRYYLYYKYLSFTVQTASM